MPYQYTPAQAASLLNQWYTARGFEIKDDSMVWSHDCIHLLLNLGIDLLSEMVVTCFENPIPQVLPYEELKVYWDTAISDYNIKGKGDFTKEKYQQVIDIYNQLNVEDIYCLADPIWWSEFVREFEYLQLPEDYLF